MITTRRFDVSYFFDVFEDGEHIGSIEHLGRARWRSTDTEGNPVGPFMPRSRSQAIAFLQQHARSSESSE